MPPLLSVVRTGPVKGGATVSAEGAEHSKFIERANMRFFLLAALAFCLVWTSAAEASAPPPSVTATHVVERPVSTNQRYIGHVAAIQSVKLVPRVTAFIDDVPVKQGSHVKAGEILFKLQTAQYEAALKTAEANLASAKAALSDANITYQRSSHLNRSGFSPASTVDQDIATRNEDEAKVLAATASLQQAELT